MTSLDALIVGADTVLDQYALVFPRVAAVIAFLPAFGERSIPGRVRLGLAVCFVLVLTPMIADDLAPPVAASGWIAIILVEILIGTFLAMIIRLLVLALQTAGAIAAQATSLSQLFGGAAADPLPALGNILLLGGLTLFIMSGLHLRAIEFLYGSYSLLPLGTLPNSQIVAEWGIGQVARSFALAFMLAFPFVVIAVAYNLVIGIINRAMPQLMVSLVGAPAISLATLALLAVMSPIILLRWHEAIAVLIVSLN